MPITTTHRTSRGAAITAALALTAALSLPAGALATDDPTFGPPTIIAAGETAPIDVGGVDNRLHQGDLIRPGFTLVRWPVAMHGADKTPTTVACPGSTIASGVGSQEGSQVFANVGRMYERTVDVVVTSPPDVDANTASGHVYVLCRDLAIAPLAPVLGVAEHQSRKAGQRIPLDITGNTTLRRGAKIQKGSQLILLPALLFERKSATMTVTCPRATVNRGIAMRRGGELTAKLASTGHYGHRNLKVRFSPRASSHFSSSTGSIYVLCSTH
jgi:hypothetical protein